MWLQTWKEAERTEKAMQELYSQAELSLHQWMCDYDETLKTVSKISGYVDGIKKKNPNLITQIITELEDL